MTFRAVGGLVVLNLFVLCVGLGILWGLRGWRGWSEFVRLSGLGYMLGVASLFVTFTIELVVGIPFTPITILLTGGILGMAGALAARRRRDVEAVGPHALRPALLVVPVFALLAIYFGALFRTSRLAPPSQDWDAWAFWLPKAKSLFLSGQLDAELIASFLNGSYPPGLTALHAAAYHAMGTPDDVTLHVQYWFLAIGFASALAGVLASRVRPVILLPFVVLVLVLPDLQRRSVDIYADLPLGYLVALAALLLLIFIEEQRPWQIGAAAIFLSGAMLTKREGALLAACVVLAALVASWGKRRSLWPPILGASAAALALALPWRIWFTAHGLESDGPQAGFLWIFSHLDQAGPAIGLVLGIFFSFDLWLLAPALALASAALAVPAGARDVPVFVLVFAVASILAAAWLVWTLPELDSESTDVFRRFIGGPVLVLTVLAPFAFERAWAGDRRDEAVESREVALATLELP